ncbi:hypothetical protein FSP39_014118 [Pinctada imbricata]|uniref:Uncharacterized protein n=1 Tax=Pinctada imbricata TaxID=66713 RepID=A0AA89C856_PINIB|nr:hypothetical protein FSP39_014118 [Pinctada imbricata]
MASSGPTAHRLVPLDIMAPTVYQSVTATESTFVIQCLGVYDWTPMDHSLLVKGGDLQEDPVAASTAKHQSTRRKRDTRHVNIKHKRLHINRRDQWATGADFGRPFVTQVANGSSLTDGKGNVTTDDGVACTDIHYYGLTIFQWFLLSALMMGINFLLLIITCAMCACRKGSNEKDFNSHQVLGALATLVDGRYHHHALNAHAQMDTLENNLYTETNTQNHHTHNNANYTLPRPSVTVHDESNCANAYPQNSSGSFTCHNGGTRVPIAGTSNTLQYDEPNYDMIDERHTEHAEWRKRPMRENFKHVGTRISQFFSNTYLSLEAKFPSRSRSPAPESVVCDDQTCKDNTQPMDVVDNTYFMLEKTNNHEEEADINIESESLD